MSITKEQAGWIKTVADDYADALAVDMLGGMLGNPRSDHYRRKLSAYLDSLTADQPQAAADLAHEIWAAAQCAPGESIEDAVGRIERLLIGESARAAKSVKVNQYVERPQDECDEPVGVDPAAALRRAIVRAAIQHERDNKNG